MLKSWAYVIARYIKEHDGENIMISDIVAEFRISRSTVSDTVNTLIREGYIVRNGKRYSVTRAI